LRPYFPCFFLLPVPEERGAENATGAQKLVTHKPQKMINKND
jgi:hypothetical protein